MSKSKYSETDLAIIKRLTGADLRGTRTFLLKECFARGEGFWSQYAGHGSVSCTTTAICVYALCETGELAEQQKLEFQRLLLGFRREHPTDQAGAFPRTTGGAPSVWTTSQAVLALLSLGAPWSAIRPSIEWLLRAQAPNGGWNFTGTHAGHERLIYTFYPILVLTRCRRRLGKVAKDAVSRASAFMNSCEEREDAFWIPLKTHVQRLVPARRRDQRERGISSLNTYWDLFEDGWPTIHVDEDWLSDRFSMALMCGSNYLHLRHTVRADDPRALLHIRYLADERVGKGWSDKREEYPKTWATALGLLTLHRWSRDLARLHARPRRLPTRVELLLGLRNGIQVIPPLSSTARSLMRRHSKLVAGTRDAKEYQSWVRDVFVFLFREVLKDPKLEVRTYLGTQRRDLTFRNAAESGPWADWKGAYQADPLLIECKNRNMLSRADLCQTACYLGKTMGRLAILACRKTTADDEREILNWFVNNDGKYILLVNDEDLIDWIRLRDRGENPSDAIADVYRSLRESVQ